MSLSLIIFFYESDKCEKVKLICWFFPTGKSMGDNSCYYVAGSACGQYKVNPVFWYRLATWAD